jgi:hypothetical protein
MGGHRGARAASGGRRVALGKGGWPAYRATLGGNQVRLRLPPQATRTERPPRTRPGRCINRAKRTTRRGHSTPRGSHALEGASEPGTDGWLSRQPVGAKGLPQSKHGHVLNALTCTFVPPAGLEPATYGLEVRHEPSAWCRRGASSQVASDLPSAWSHPGRHRDNDRIATGIASLTTGPPVRHDRQPGRSPSSPCPEQTAHAEDHQLHHKARPDSSAAPGR